MRQTRRFLLLLTMLLTATFGMSQTVIVKDSITNEPIPFVSVYFGNDTGGYTDENGKITIPNEAAQIRLSHICYETKSISKITVDSQTIFLVPKSINLDEVAIAKEESVQQITASAFLKRHKIGSPSVSRRLADALCEKGLLNDDSTLDGTVYSVSDVFLSHWMERL